MRIELTEEAERELRAYLWLSHGHRGVYGDDGEMQCGECLPFGLCDYKRELLEKVIWTASRARQAVNLAILQAVASSETRKDDPRS